tara:strand:+ start:52 stop:384 length:333 start_codon:yes stop_codon:yes gene_type:complete
MNAQGTTAGRLLLSEEISVVLVVMRLLRAGDVFSKRLAGWFARALLSRERQDVAAHGPALAMSTGVKSRLTASRKGDDDNLPAAFNAGFFIVDSCSGEPIEMLEMVLPGD